MIFCWIPNQDEKNDEKNPTFFLMNLTAIPKLFSDLECGEVSDEDIARMLTQGARSH